MKKTIAFIFLLALASAAGATELDKSGSPVFADADMATFTTYLYEGTPVLESVTAVPSAPVDGRRVRVRAAFRMDPWRVGRPADRAALNYSTDAGATWNRLEMAADPLDSSSFTAVIPAQKAGVKVRYYITAHSPLGHVTTELPGHVSGWDGDGEPANMPGVEDPDDDEKTVMADIDVRGLRFGHDADNFYLGIEVEGKPGPGSMSGGGAYAYLMPLMNLSTSKGTADLHRTPFMFYSPMAASLLGAPKYGIVLLTDLGGGKKIEKDDKMEMRKGKNSLYFRFPKDRLGSDFSSGIELTLITAAIKGFDSGLSLWDAAPYLTVYPRTHEYTVAAPAEIAPAPLMAGAAQADITPPVGTPLTGYGDRTGKPSTGVHDPLESQALVIDAGGEKYVIVTIDALYVMRRFCIEVSGAIEKKLGIPREHILYMTSHSHSSSGALFPEVSILGGLYNEDVYRKFVNDHVDLIARAAANVKPARIGFGAADGTGLSRNRVKDMTAVDPSVTVMRVDNEKGAPIAVMFNFAAHPTMMGGSNMEFSADYPGAARTAIEKAFPGAVAMFANGAIGNQAPSCPGGDCGGSGFDAMETVGRTLGERAAATAKGIKTAPEAVTALAVEEPLLSARYDIRTTLAALRIGDGCMVTDPGELFVELGLEVKADARAAGCAHVMLLGLANDGIGYILPEELYHKHIYESTFAIFGPKEGPFIRERMSALVKEAAF